MHGPTPFPLVINEALGVPLYRQICDSIKELVAVGTLKPGDQLPSIRELSGQLGINPASAVKAYSELKHAGLIDLDQGRGTFVRRDLTPGKSREALLTPAFDALIARGRAMGLSDTELKRALAQRLKNLELDFEGAD